MKELAGNTGLVKLELPLGPMDWETSNSKACLPLSSKIVLFAKIMMVCKLGLLSRTPREDVWMLLQACMGCIWWP